MKMQSQTRLVAESGSLHPLKIDVVKVTDEAEASFTAHSHKDAFLAFDAIPTADDEREAELQNVAVLGYN